MTRIVRLLTALAASALVSLTAPGAMRAAQAPPDLILVNGRIVTADDARPGAEAIAMRGETIVAL
nr:amidohydrolase [Acidobacteriota bacterium]